MPSVIWQRSFVPCRQKSRTRKLIVHYNLWLFVGKDQLHDWIVFYPSALQRIPHVVACLCQCAEIVGFHVGLLRLRNLPSKADRANLPSANAITSDRIVD